MTHISDDEMRHLTPLLTGDVTGPCRPLSTKSKRFQSKTQKFLVTLKILKQEKAINIRKDFLDELINYNH